MFFDKNADVAELADAHDSGSCARNGVEVQVLSSAPELGVNFSGLFVKPPHARSRNPLPACEAVVDLLVDTQAAGFGDRVRCRWAA
jgi:hypothetical protein